MSGTSQYVAVLRFTSLAEARLYGRVESDLWITRFAVNVSWYFHYPIVAEWLARWTRAQNARVQIAAATL